MDTPLTRAFDAAFGLPPEFCTACLGPSKNGPGVFVLEGDEELGECESCGGGVAANGRSIRRLGQDGRPSPVKVIHLVDCDTDLLDEPPVTGDEP